jgi:A/G-specific adenine glycosylase
MTTSSFAKKLISWFEKNKRSLPWRQTRDPYKIWVSEIMLQQTTVNAVIPYYKRWIKRFPTIYHLAKAQRKTVLTYWQGLGYYRRAKHLHITAKIIVKDFHGKIPNNREVLRKLPGFGPYTTGAVLSIAFGEREAIIDANVRRVIMRILSIRGQANTTHDQKINRFLKTIMPQTKMSEFNQGLMELGALICQSKDVQCVKCPVRVHCKAYAKGIQELIPSTQKKKLKIKDVCVGIIHNNNRFFIQKRPSSGLLADLWEFPGGQKEKGESLIATLKREIKEELGVNVTAAKIFLKTKHFYTQFSVNLYAFTCKVEPWPKSNRIQKWVTLKAFERYPMPSGTCKIVEQLKIEHKSKGS